jgi:hypothetical protein
VLAYRIPADPTAPGSVTAQLVAGVDITFGTLIGFAQIPNREGKFAHDQDLGALSLAFLGIGGLLPIAGSFRAHRQFTHYGLIVLLILDALFQMWYARRWWRKRKSSARITTSQPS